MEEGECFAWEMVRTGRLTRPQLMDIRAAFRFFDKNGDGVITTEELATTVQYLGHQASSADLQDMMNQVDKDGNGCIDFKEFIGMMCDYFEKLSKSPNGDVYQRVFTEFDRNGDGFIDVEELESTMKAIGVALDISEIREMIEEADCDGDGRVSFQEFVQILQP
ncbi:unnamed protein product [Dicrocoelium dendriticum]|nr:unnamed protein product [Dicrocoelium dendriticum]